MKCIAYLVIVANLQTVQLDPSNGLACIDGKLYKDDPFTTIRDYECHYVDDDGDIAEVEAPIAAFMSHGNDMCYLPNPARYKRAFAEALRLEALERSDDKRGG